MFPFTAVCSSNIKQLRPTDKKKAVNFLKEYIESYKGKDIAITEDELSFKANIFSPLDNKFAGINKGTFVLTSSKIIFKFQMYGLFIALFVVAISMLLTRRYIDMITVAAVIIIGNWFIYFFKFRKMTTWLAKKINAGI
jgi:hypothetical protein